MPCCTYLGEQEFTWPTSDAELNSLLADIRERTGDDWRIAERIETVGVFRKQRFKRYTLYNHVGGPEFQIINFYRPDRADEPLSSINHYNDAGYVAAYLYGLLAGLASNAKGGSR